jgi:hypothetical protein
MRYAQMSPDCLTFITAYFLHHHQFGNRETDTVTGRDNLKCARLYTFHLKNMRYLCENFHFGKIDFKRTVCRASSD